MLSRVRDVRVTMSFPCLLRGIVVGKENEFEFNHNIGL